jgi:hypothetical protein
MLGLFGLQRKRKKELTPEEKACKGMLYHIADREKLKNDILAIKRDPDFIPNYKSPARIHSVAHPPSEFNSFEEWYQAMRADAKEAELREIKEKHREELWKQVVDCYLTPAVMNEMMRVD